MPTTYTIAIDYDDDGDFTDPGEDITADVLSLRWRLGMAQPYDHMAAPIRAEITVRNRTRDYSPEYTADPLLPRKSIRIQSDDGTTTRTHFRGYIDRIDPTPGAQGSRTATIHAVGPEFELEQNRILLPPQINVRADQVIDAILDACILRQPNLKGYWLLSLPEHTEVEETTRLAEDYPRALETGKSTFAYVGDNWTDGIPATEAIRQLVEAERGRFFVDRDGTPTFHNRHHATLNQAASAAFTDDMDGLEYTYGQPVVNHIQVRLTPRGLGTPGTAVWTLEKPFRLRRGSDFIVYLIVQYRDADQRPTGAIDIIPPIPGLDYQANSAEDGSGEDLTLSYIEVVAAPNFSGAALRFYNYSPVPQETYILAGTQLRGTPVLRGDPIIIEQSDLTSQSLYGLNTLLLDLPALNDVEESDQLARYELSRRKDPRGIVRTITLESPSHISQILARALFDRITITDTQTAHEAGYFIIAEEHTIDQGGARHGVTWLLEPAAASRFWIVETDTLDQTTTLAY